MSFMDLMHTAVEKGKGAYKELQKQTEEWYGRFYNKSDDQLMEYVRSGTMAQKLAAKRHLNERGYGSGYGDN